MPTTRRTAGAGATAGKQSTLSFNHRVTKASVPVGKQAAKAAAASAPAKQSPLAKQIEDTVSAPTAADDEAVVEITPEDEAADGQAKVEDVVVAEVKDEEKSEAEVKALKMTDRHIETYWRDVEAERIAKRVHQEELGTPEKVLRYFDVSSQYGVCHVLPLSLFCLSSRRDDKTICPYSSSPQLLPFHLADSFDRTALYRTHAPQAVAAR